MTETRNCTVLVVGGGPGGYPAAIRAGQLGMDTILVEGDRLGGTCLIRGCIPSKAMIQAATRYEETRKLSEDGEMGISISGESKLDMGELVAWKDGVVDKLSGGVGSLLKAAKVEHVEGWAEFEDAKTCTVRRQGKPALKITAEHVILANGSVEAELPFMKFDGGTVISSRDALSLAQMPEHLAVVGAGYIGLELGIAYAKMGAKVTVVEAADSILPAYDGELSRPVAQWMKAHGVTVHLSCKAKGVVQKGNETHLEFETKEGEIESARADKVLVAVGRRPNTQGWGLENMAVDMDGPFVKVDARCATSMRNVWAIGDLVGEPMLAHKATAQGEMVAEIIAGHRREFDHRHIAAVCFTEPEIVGVGLTPDEARAQGEEVIVGKFPFAASGRALAMGGGTDGGFVRVTARASDHVVIGIHAVGAHAAELSGEFAHAIEMCARLEDIAGTIHVHPTLTEATGEAALAALGHPIHIPAPRR